MATYNKFESFVGELGIGLMDLNASLFKVYLAATATAPNASADTIKSDIAEIAAGSGYTAGGEDVTNTYSEAGGTGTMGATDVTWNATGTMPASGGFQFVVLYNDTHASDGLVCWWDYGSSLTLSNGESFTVDFGTDQILTIV